MPKPHWDKSHSCSSTGHKEARQGVYQRSACRADGATGEARVLCSSVPSAGAGGSSAATRTERFSRPPAPYQPAPANTQSWAHSSGQGSAGGGGWKLIKGCLGTSTVSSQDVAAASPTSRTRGRARKVPVTFSLPPRGF